MRGLPFADRQDPWTLGPSKQAELILRPCTSPHKDTCPNLPPSNLTLFFWQAEVLSLDILRAERAVSSAADRTCRVWKIPEESQLLFKWVHSWYCGEHGLLAA